MDNFTIFKLYSGPENIKIIYVNYMLIVKRIALVPSQDLLTYIRVVISWMVEGTKASGNNDNRPKEN